MTEFEYDEEEEDTNAIGDFFSQLNPEHVKTASKWAINGACVGIIIWLIVQAFLTETYFLIAVAILPGLILIGMIYFQPLNKEERKAIEQREKEIEEANDMGLIA